MSKLAELIEELCPNGVEWKTLGELGKFYGGLTGKSKEDFIDGNAKFISYKNVYANPAVNMYVEDKVKISVNEKQRHILLGDVIFTGSSENLDECGLSSVVTIKPKELIYVNSFCFIFRFDEPQHFVPDFSKHLFRSLHLRQQIVKTANGVTRFNVSKKLMERVKVPVPPLEVQREIVHILDSFTLLTAELTAELTARKKQYEYYRDDLLTFSHNEVKFMSFDELFDVKNGLNKGKEYFGHGSPIINFTDVYNRRWLTKELVLGMVDVTQDEIERYSAQKGDVFFTRTSETKEDIGMASTLIEDIENCVFSGFVLRARPKTDLLLPKFCAYYFSSKVIRDTIVRYASFTTRATTTGEKLSKIKVPILPKEVQEKIVYALDNFDAICSDLNIGLPAEIEARQKQYEFYRDALLTYAATGKIIASQVKSSQVKSSQVKSSQVKSSHSRLNTLIKLCQYVFGTIFVKLSDFAIITRGGNFQKKDFVAEGVPCIHYGQMYTHFGVHTREPLTYISQEVAAKSKMAEPNAVIMAVTSENIEDVCKCTAWLGSGPIAVSGHTAIIQHDQNAKYLAYYFHTEMFAKQKRKLAHGTKVIEVTPSALGDIIIPLPPLEEQARIVGILDKFDAICNDLTGTLPAEISKREQQYAFYRDKLLSFKPLEVPVREQHN